MWESARKGITQNSWFSSKLLMSKVSLYTLLLLNYSLLTIHEYIEHQGKRKVRCVHVNLNLNATIVQEIKTPCYVNRLYFSTNVFTNLESVNKYKINLTCCWNVKRCVCSLDKETLLVSNMKWNTNSTVGSLVGLVNISSDTKVCRELYFRDLDILIITPHVQLAMLAFIQTYIHAWVRCYCMCLLNNFTENLKQIESKFQHSLL